MDISSVELFSGWLELPLEDRQEVLSRLGDDFEGVRQGGLLHFRRLNVVGNFRCCESLHEPYEILDLGQSYFGRPFIVATDFGRLLSNSEICLNCFADKALNQALRVSLSDV
jgi:hypothetical protein